MQREPAWWQHRIFVFVLVYAVPFLAIETWGYLGWKRYLEYRRFDHLDPLDLTLDSLYMPFRAFGPWTLIMLLAMAAYAVRPRPATALVSFVANAFWCYFGHCLVALGF